MAEFIKRFLVVTLVPDGILDLYFYNNECVAFQFSVLQQSTLHWFMYFAKDEYTKCGIWFHGILLALHRGQRLLQKNDYQNFFVKVHQIKSKRNAGLEACQPNDMELMSQIFPIRWSQPIPADVANLSLWKKSKQQ